jgi:hypothetical protein
MRRPPDQALGTAVTPAGPQAAASSAGRKGTTVDRTVQRFFCASRAALGTAYLTWSAATGSRRNPPAPARPVAAILGARHLVQALLTSDQPTRAVLVLGAEADAAHALSMAALGLFSGRWRRAALLDALLAASLATAGLACARSADSAAPTTGPLRALRDRQAERLARHLAPQRAVLETALTGRREKIIGSWNKLLVMAGRMFPGLGNQYAALGAWSTQLTGQPISADRPVNLYHPADAEEDHGARGQFSHMAGGFLDPSHLKTIPTTAKTFAIALTRDLAGKRRRITLPRQPRPAIPLTQKK